MPNADSVAGCRFEKKNQTDRQINGDWLFFFFFFFFIQFNVPFKIISRIETSQSIGGAKR